MLGIPVPGEIDTNIDSHVLSPTEKKLAEYKCTQLLFPKCTGHMIVTNERLIFFGQGVDNRIVNEVQIQTVTGLKSFYGRKLNTKLLLWGCVLCLIAIILLISSIVGLASTPRSSYYGYSNPISGIATAMGILGIVVSLGLAGASIVLLSFCYPKVFNLSIYAAATGAAIQIGEPQISGGVGSTAMYAVIGRPTPETDQMMRELGAWIKAVQKGMMETGNQGDTNEAS